MKKSTQSPWGSHMVIADVRVPGVVGVVSAPTSRSRPNQYWLSHW